MLKTAKVVGLNSDTEAALAFISTGKSLLISPARPSEREETIDPGLFMIISCKAEDAFSRTRQALVAAEDLFNSSEKSLSDRLNEIADFLKQTLADVEELKILLVVIQEEEIGAALYLLRLGDSLSAYLIRGDKKNDLCHMAEEGHLISGLLQPGDRIILMTGSLQEIVGEDLGILPKVALESLEDELVVFLPSGHVYPVAVIVIDKEKIEPDTSVLKELEVEEPAPKLNVKLSFNPGRFIPRSKRSILILGIILIAVVGAVVGLNFKHKKDAEATTRFQNLYQKASFAYSQAASLKDVDSVAANKNLTEAKVNLAEALNIKPNDSQALSLKKQLEDSTGEVLKAFVVADFPIWLDLNLIKEGFRANSLSLSHGNLLVLDTNKNTLIKINASTKAPQILGGGEKLGDSVLSSINGEVSWVYSKDKGVIKIEGKDEPKVVIKKDDNWGEIADIYGFAGNLYLLDTNKGQVWKYLPITNGYSDAREYLTKGVSGNFVGAKKMEIDSSVWILKGDGDILKYTQGNPDFFSIGGLDKPINNPKSFFVSDQTDSFYLLDSGNSRLLVLDKKGIYKAQYQADAFKNFVDLVVDEENKKVYLLDGSKIFQIDLK